jgi:hypothetical protein
MKFIIFSVLLFVQSLSLASTKNPDLNEGIKLAEQSPSVVENTASWKEFKDHVFAKSTTPTEFQTSFQALILKGDDAPYFRDQIISLFEAYKRAKAISEATGLDVDFREEHGLGDGSTAPSPGRSTATRGRGGSVVSGTHRTAMSRGFSVGASTTAMATDQVSGLLDQIRKLRQDTDLTNAIGRSDRASVMNAANPAIREANLQAFLEQDDLRASYIKVLLDSAAHRGDVLTAINSADHAAFRGALIQSLLANAATRKEVLDALHGAHSGEMINAIHGGAHRGEMIAKLHGEDASRGEVVAHLSTNHAGDMVAKVVADHRPAVIAALVPAHIDDLTPLLGTNEPFRTAMLDRLLIGHRPQVIDALIPTYLDAILATHRDAILESLGMGTLDERIASLRDDVTNRGAIAQAFVDNEAFRNALITRLEAGRFAINATRMLWHDIDAGAPHAAFWASVAAGTPNLIVTNVAFEHLLQKAREGYQNISSLTGQRGKFRSGFATGNLVGKDGSHLGSRQTA